MRDRKTLARESYIQYTTLEFHQVMTLQHNKKESDQSLMITSTSRANSRSQQSYYIWSIGLNRSLNSHQIPNHL